MTTDKPLVLTSIELKPWEGKDQWSCQDNQGNYWSIYGFQANVAKAIESDQAAYIGTERTYTVSEKLATSKAGKNYTKRTILGIPGVVDFESQGGNKGGGYDPRREAGMRAGNALTNAVTWAASGGFGAGSFTVEELLKIADQFYAWSEQKSRSGEPQPVHGSEHSTVRSSGSTTDPGSALQTPVIDRPAQSPPSRFTKGPHAGESFEEVPTEYLAEVIEKRQLKPEGLAEAQRIFEKRMAS